MKRTIFKMKDEIISSARIIIAVSGILIALGIALEAMSAHLPDHFFIDAHHRHYLHLAAATLIPQSIGASLLSICPFTPLCRKTEAAKWLWASWLILAGLVLFSSTLSLLAFSMISQTFLAPAGALLQMLGWIMPAFICIRGVFQKNAS